MPAPTNSCIAQVPPEVEIRLSDFCVRTGLVIKQENGQRKYGGPPSDWKGPAPEKGSEVFVGKLPRDMYEDELIPVFSQMGTIYELRLMMDFSGTNRGYCFITFGSKQEAKKACRQLNNHEIRLGKHIGVMMSVDNCRLFVGGIPRDRKREEIKAEMEKLSDGVVEVILYPSANDKTKNRGFAFVEYVTHRAAAMARRKLVPSRVQLWGQQICVDWAEPEQDVDEDTMANVKILYVRNLMLDTTEETIRQIFEKIKPGSIERVKKLKDYAFVHFFDRQDALNVMEQMNGSTLDGAEIEVVLAKPADKSIMKYVKNVQKLGNQALPPAPTVHQSIVAAATQMYAANRGGGQNGTVTPPSPPCLLQSIQQDPLAWAFTGYPGVEPLYSCSAYQQSAQERFLNIHRPHVSASSNRLSRGAAGMRAAGFQAFVSNQVRKNRRKLSEAALVYEVSPYTTTLATTGPHPLTPVVPPAGVVLIPTTALAPATLQPAVNPVGSQPSPTLSAGSPPTLVVQNTARTQTFSEQLEEHCRKQEWGSPLYETLSPILTKDGLGRDIPLYICKATIPALLPHYGAFQPGRFMTDPEQAKEFTAFFILLQLGLSIEGGVGATAEFSGPVMPTFQ